MTNLRHEFQRHAEKKPEKSLPPFSLRLTYEERVAVCRREGQTAGRVYPRERLLGDDADAWFGNATFERFYIHTKAATL